MRSSSHTLDPIEVVFDDDHLVADAGLIQPATLAQHLGLRQLFERHIDLGDAPGRANVGHKAMCIIHSALAGGDSIDDCDALRAGSTQSVLGHGVLAPSTLGTFLRSLTVRRTKRTSISTRWHGSGPSASYTPTNFDGRHPHRVPVVAPDATPIW